MFNRYYINILINIFLFSYISFLKEALSSEINLVIRGQGNKALLNGSFYTEPTEVYVEGNRKDNCKKTCQLTDTLNNVKLVFNQEIDSCENMFYGPNDIIEIDLSNFDTSKVTSMNSMFRSCQNLTKINFGNIKTSSVRDMSFLFESCKKLTSIDVSNFDTSSVTNMNYMFSGCDLRGTFDLSNFNTVNLKEMGDLFSNNYNLVSVNISSFDTSNVINMKGMFFDCKKLAYLDLHNFNGNYVTGLSYLFFSCSSLVFINLRSFKIVNTGNVNKDYHTYGISNSVKSCIEDSTTKSFLSLRGNDCSNICFQENIKFDIENNACVESCNENKYQFNRECYSNCPENTYKILKDIKMCEKIIQENYYLDSDNFYKECYNLCQKCSQSGNAENNNCDKCINNYNFLSDSSVPQKNCYPKCSNYYYFNENGDFICTGTKICPSQYNKLISSKNKCIDDCKNDGKYIYEYNNVCLETCTQGLKIYESEKKCLDECYSYQFEYNNICYNDCPSGTHRLFLNRNICIVEVPENYYLDNNDNIYKRCYNLCKTCIQSGDETINNCDKCINEYTFLNESSFPSKNCFKKCEFYYYFNKSEEYTCTQFNFCPSPFNKTVIGKYKCIDDCRKDDEYKYDYKNTCLKKCSDNVKNYEEEKICLDML